MGVAMANVKPSPSGLDQRPKQDLGTLDQHISVLQDELCSVKRHRNMKTPINAKLPPEILSRIFLHVKELVHYSLRACCYGPTRNSWASSTTHVCSHWRSVALSYPFLWNSGFPVQMSGLQTFLERSKNVPIVLDRAITDRRVHHPTFRLLFLSHMARVGRLEMSVCESDIHDTLRALDADMPYLHTLDIQLSAPLRRIDFSRSFPRPENLNRVRHLRLKFYGFPWSKVELTNLVHLEMIGDLNPAHDPSTLQMLDILKRSPSLKILALSNLVRDNRKGQDEDTMSTKISLPLLETLLLHQTGLAFTKSLICNATLPKVKDITLEISMNDGAIVTSLLTRAAQHLHHARPAAIMFAFEDPRDETYVFQSVYDNRSKFRFCNLTPHIACSQATLLCMEESDLSTLDTLLCIVNEDLPVDWWRRIFGPADNLDMLAVHGPFNLNSFLCALTPDESLDLPAAPESHDNAPGSLSTKSNDDSATILPSLESLIFGNVSFTLQKHPHDGRITGGSIEHLVHCLKQRVAYNRRLSELTTPLTRATLNSMGVNLGGYVEELIYATDISTDSASNQDEHSDDDAGSNISPNDDISFD